MAQGVRKRLADLARASHNTGVTEKLEMRIYGDASLPTLIYLPELDGDWTLVGGFRRALGDRVRPAMISVHGPI